MNFFDVLYNEILLNFDTWFVGHMANNDFLVATVFGILSGVGLYLLRNVPIRIYNMIRSRVTVTVTINNDNEYFVPITRSLNENAINMFSRSLMLDGKAVTIGFANSLSKFMGKYVYVNRVEKESDAREFKQSVTLTFIGLKKANIEKLFDEFIENYRKKNFDKIGIYKATSPNGYLNHFKNIPIRPRKSIFVSEDTLDYIERRIDFFLQNRAWYESKGIPYKYAIILHGPPGTGKTTLAKYIASYSKRNLVYMNLVGLKSIATMISSYQRDEYNEYGEEKSKDEAFIGLLEDIDSDKLTHNRDGEDGEENNSKSLEPISFTDVLNSIDGLNAPEDFILVATTNHIDRIDPALKRKGRFDDVIEIGLLADRDIKRMIDFYFPNVFDWEKLDVTFEPIEGAKLQDKVLGNIDNPEQVLQTLTKEENFK